MLIFVLGESGSGKSTSLRNIDPSKTFLVNVAKKPLPFKNDKWVNFDGKVGSVINTRSPATIIETIKRAEENGRDMVVIDDAQYIMSFEFMARALEKGYDKFTHIGDNFFRILDTAMNSNTRVYILSHTEKDATGSEKIKTIGKMLDEKITLEGLATIVLYARCNDEEYVFETNGNGRTTAKSPMGMFDHKIDNDLKFVDDEICKYYNIKKTKGETK